MKFGIITPTYNRYSLLKRCIDSVLKQSYSLFEIIIIDDSTDDESKNHIFKDFPDTRIKYYKNKKNSGVNFSRNFGLDNLSKDVDYVLFLDDDDYFNKDTLLNHQKEIDSTLKGNWFISNKKGITVIPDYKKGYSYLEDYLFGQKISGDATHCISKESIGSIRFSKYIKQAQEWLFFIEISVKNNIVVFDYDSTISEYLEGGLSDTSKLFNSCMKFLALLEFLFFRKIPLITKIYLLKIIIGKLKVT